ncbi:MAG: hypothetical protein SFV52_14835 [Saprospiraceae bacterium]|nr:hypothetical protein [Saprospiraceae bacterium]
MEEHPGKSGKPPLWPLLLPVAPAAWAVALRLHAYAQTPYANGWDAYFYLVQLKALDQTGRMHSPDASLIYPFFRLLNLFFGDYVAAYQSGAALLAGLIVLVTGFACSSGNRGAFQLRDAGARYPSASIWALCWMTGSPHLTYFCAQYPKNALGWVFFLALYGVLQRETANRRLQYARVAGLLTLCFFGHRVTFALGVLLVGGYWMFGNQWRIPMRSLWWTLLLLLLFTGAGVLLPGLLHVRDLERLSGAWSGNLHVAPWSFVLDFGSQRLTPCWRAEIAISALAWLAFPLFWKKGSAAQKSLWLLGLVLLWPFLEWTSTGLAYRFFLLFVLLMPLYAGVWMPRLGNMVWIPAIFPVLAGPWTSMGYSPEKHDPDYRLYEKVSARTVQFFSANGIRPDLVIAHNALAEFFTYTHGIDAMPWLPEYPIGPDQLWRIALTDVRRVPDTLQAIPLVGRYVLLREVDWHAWRRLRTAENDPLTPDWRNPDRVRPEFLLHKKKNLRSRFTR